MGQPAARVGDNIKQDTPHCHAPIHPPAPTPTPAPHPALPLAILGPGCQTVRIGAIEGQIAETTPTAVVILTEAGRVTVPAKKFNEEASTLIAEAS